MRNEYTEDQAIRALHRLAKRWPRGKLWLFSASGTLCVMRSGANSEHVVTADGGVDTNYIADTVDISNDGGD